MRTMAPKEQPGDSLHILFVFLSCSLEIYEGGHIGHQGWVVLGGDEQCIVRWLTNVDITCRTQNSNKTFMIEWKWKRNKMHNMIIITM